jgi:predicted nucleic acid-binding protein
VRFWDASALVPLLITQALSEQIERIADADPSIATWWATSLECRSAIARLEREGVRSEAIGKALATLETLEESWTEIAPSNFVRSMAGRLLRTHPLRTGDALQLAAAIAVADGNPRGMPFVTLDERLALAASKEGFPVVTTA